MRLPLKMLGALLFIGLAIALSAISDTADVAPLKAQALFDKNMDAIDRWLPHLIRDAAAIREHPFATPRPHGRDAGPLLNDLFDWDSGGKIVRKGSLPHIDPTSPDFDARKLDFSWMARLSDYETWDIHTPLIGAPQFDLRDPTKPVPRDILDWAKARLALGDTPEARSEVGNLARLCIQSESWLHLLTGIEMAKMSGHLNEEEYRRWTRVGFAQLAFAGTIEVDSEYRALATDPRLAAMRCPGVSDASNMSLLMKHYLEDAHQPDYSDLRQTFSELSSECRLSWLKWSWDNGHGSAPVGTGVFCLAGSQSRLCLLPDFLVQSSSIKEAIGYTFLAVARIDGFSVYQRQSEAPKNAIGLPTDVGEPDLENLKQAH